MISKDELKEYAELKNLNLGQAEKDYFQNLLLYILYQEHGKELVFKGGTALSKCYGLNRFSEDLDFTASTEINAKSTIEKGLKRFNVDYEVKEAEELRFLMRGPLYTGIRQSFCTVRVEVSTREEIQKDTKKVTIRTFTPTIPNFQVIVMSPEEIYAEKIRALFTRKQARDLYDIYMIQGRTPTEALVNEKLKYYSKEFSLEEAEKHVEDLERIWEKELKPLMKEVPDYGEVKEIVLEELKALK